MLPNPQSSSASTCGRFTAVQTKSRKNRANPHKLRVFPNTCCLPDYLVVAGLTGTATFFFGNFVHGWLDSAFQHIASVLGTVGR